MRLFSHGRAAKDHHSDPHNPNLARAFYRARIIEHWETGTLRIIKACEERNMPRPVFSLAIGMFRVRFEKPPVPVSLPQTTHINDRQHQAITYTRRNGRLTTIQYQALFSLSERQARRDLKAPVDAGILESAEKGPATFCTLSADIIQ